MQPFSITLFATTGDPEGIRYVDKSNGSVKRGSVNGIAS